MDINMNDVNPSKKHPSVVIDLSSWLKYSFLGTSESFCDLAWFVSSHSVYHLISWGHHSSRRVYELLRLFRQSKDLLLSWFDFGIKFVVLWYHLLLSVLDLEVALILRRDHSNTSSMRHLSFFVKYLSHYIRLFSLGLIYFVLTSFQIGLLCFLKRLNFGL